MDVIRRQSGVQTVLIGDTAQAINAWAGAHDSIEQFDAPELTLTRSFRFGQDIADEGNKWLDALGVSMRITGTGESTVHPVPSPTCVLTRTNGAAVSELMEAQASGKRVSLAGQKAKSEIEQLCDAADGLKAGKGTHVKSLMAFTYWSELQDYVRSEGKDLAPFVKVVDEYGTGVVRSALRGLTRPERADLVVGTAHVSKGLEFDRVRVGGDFASPAGDAGVEALSQQEMKLSYVAVTRAKRELDPGSLAWPGGKSE